MSLFAYRTDCGQYTVVGLYQEICFAEITRPSPCRMLLMRMPGEELHQSDCDRDLRRPRIGADPGESLSVQSVNQTGTHLSPSRAEASATACN